MILEDFLPVVLIVVIILAIIIKIKWKSIKNYIRGKFGERKVSRMLNKIPNSILINNLTFSVNENMTCQIDHILVSTRGIFVIETKNYAGRIYGDDSKKEWTQLLQYGKVKNTFYSPVKQNITHIYELSKRLKRHELKNLVIFVQNNINYIKSDYVLPLVKVKKYIINHYEFLSFNDVENIANEINLLNENISNREHVKNIKNMKNNIENNICPRCGASLAIRSSKNGSFYGCPNYPKCKFTKKV